MGIWASLNFQGSREAHLSLSEETNVWASTRTFYSRLSRKRDCFSARNRIHGSKFKGRGPMFLRNIWSRIVPKLIRFSWIVMVLNIGRCTASVCVYRVVADLNGPWVKKIKKYYSYGVGWLQADLLGLVFQSWKNKPGNASPPLDDMSQGHACCGWCLGK